ncbi:trans-sialidase [Trypanosoma cruzi Dm28c]|uniref:Trans-sialidase n=1 Tax=Trypanosoma cruzi Dm28c TaxID=1416333 RepID=V5B9J6_TRYCR|nr:trans-sialidase [Trypanosoma cruzi Dm28c]
MLSRVAAVMAPRTHNRRRVTGSSGRRKEGRESEPQRPNMSRCVFSSTALLLLVVKMCCGGAATAQVEKATDASTSGSALTDAITAEGSASGGVEGLQGVDLFVPQTTLVLPKTGTTESGRRDSFVSPSLVSAGGVIAAFAEGHINVKYTADQLSCLLMLLRSTSTLRGNGPLLLKRSKRKNGVHTPCLVKRRERGAWMLCATPQQLRRATRCFFLWEALPCPM